MVNPGGKFPKLSYRQRFHCPIRESVNLFRHCGEKERGGQREDILKSSIEREIESESG